MNARLIIAVGSLGVIEACVSPIMHMHTEWAYIVSVTGFLCFFLGLLPALAMGTLNKDYGKLLFGGATGLVAYLVLAWLMGFAHSTGAEISSLIGAASLATGAGTLLTSGFSVSSTR